MGKTRIRTHYLPQFVLRQFWDGQLFELDRVSGECERRAIENGGQELDLYPARIEDGLFRQLDNAASKILQKKVYGKQRIVITEEDKRILSEWLLFFAVRIPLNLEVCNHMARQWNANPQNTLDALDQDIDLIVEDMKRQNPEGVSESAAKLGGLDQFKLVLHGLLRQEVLSGRARALAGGRRTFEQMQESGKHRGYIADLFKLRWTWLYTNGDFILGDNPLCRWHLESRTPNYGIQRRGIEITIPLSRKLTLWMHRNYTHADFAICNGQRTKELNNRQMQSSFRKVYGPSRRALRLGEDYGF
jgi:hypothetical protein